jgi:dolichol-phosphate mannosyltransferase
MALVAEYLSTSDAPDPPVARGQTRRSIELTLVVPTFNEAANIGRFVERVAECLDGIGWEIVFVDDDSPDNTSERIAAIARVDRRVRFVRRIGRRGLASACIEGILTSPATFVAVMDADLQHDARLLPAMVAKLRRGEVDCVVASRYLAADRVAGWDQRRAEASRLATWFARFFTSTTLTDPMSGYFMLRRDAVLPLLPRLSGVGFKILLDIVLTAPPSLRIVELPGRFVPREIGESKFDARAAYDFLVAQLVATLAAMTGNFLLNNELTYRDRRLRGSRLLRGWLSFGVGCSVGLVANVGVAAELFADNSSWWMSALGGIAIGAVWNYAVTSFYTWGKA